MSLVAATDVWNNTIGSIVYDTSSARPYVYQGNTTVGGNEWISIEPSPQYTYTYTWHSKSLREQIEEKLEEIRNMFTAGFGPMAAGRVPIDEKMEEIKELLKNINDWENNWSIDGGIDVSFDPPVEKEEYFLPDDLFEI